MRIFDDHIILVNEFQAGNPVADKLIFEKFYKPLCLFADNIVKKTQPAEDIVTEIFIKVFNKRHEFDNIQCIKVFLYTAVRNACINFCKAEKRHFEIYKEVELIAGNTLQDVDVIKNEIYMAEIIHAIYLEIEKLPVKCQLIFKLLFFKGLSTDDVARQLHINPQTVRTQKARAIQIVKSRLSKKEEWFALTILATTLARVI